MSINEMTSTAREYRQLMADIKALEEQAESLKQAMIREMDTRQVDELAAGEFKIRYNIYESTRLDSKKLKAEHGDLYAAYTKQTASGFACSMTTGSKYKQHRAGDGIPRLFLRSLFHNNAFHSVMFCLVFWRVASSIPLNPQTLVILGFSDLALLYYTGSCATSLLGMYDSGMKTR